MKIVGIICEYNPFHLGHAAQIAYLRQRLPDWVICTVMSGGFVQRGGGAVLPKYVRARTAAECGADLVFELPYPWSGARAETFADAGVSMLTALGASVLCFGSTGDDAVPLLTAAKNMEEARFREALLAAKDREKHGNLSSVRLSQQVYIDLFGAGFPTSPNDILGVEYCRAILRSGSRMEPLTYVRTPGYSAAEARAAMLAGDEARLSALVPGETVEAVHSVPPLTPAMLSPVLLSLLRFADPAQLERDCALPGGFAFRALAAAREVQDAEALVAALVSRRETAAQVRRLLLTCALHTKRERTETLPAYALLLAASGKGREALRTMKKTSSVPILTKPADHTALAPAAQEQFLFSVRAETLLQTARGEKPSDLLRQKPFLLPE